MKQYNSVNLAPMGLDRCQMTAYSRLLVSNEKYFVWFYSVITCVIKYNMITAFKY